MFFSLSPDAHTKTVIAETLLLAADLAYQIETLAKSPSLIIADRGLLSLVCYQAVRLAHSEIFGSCVGAAKFIIDALKPLSVAWTHIQLTGLGTREICERAKVRGGPVPNAAELEFLGEVEVLMTKIGPLLGPYFRINAYTSITETNQIIHSIIRTLRASYPS